MGVSKEVLEHLKRADSRLWKVIEEIGDLQINTYNPSSDELLFLIREIIGQMISSGVKKVIWQRLKDLCDNEVSSETLTNLTIEQLRSIGLSNAKSGYILNLANLVSDNTINFDYINSLDDEGVIKELKKNYKDANIVAIDYDPGASEVNQLNRIKLMLSTAFTNLKNDNNQN